MRTTAPHLRLVETKPLHVPLRCRPGTGVIIAAVIGAGVWLIVVVAIWP